MSDDPDELRDKLNKITQQHPDQHSDLLKELRDQFPHTVEMQIPRGSTSKYNCVMHAFDFVDCPDYIALCEDPSCYALNVFADTCFVKFVITHQEMVEQPHPFTGLLAVYFDGSTVRHIGKFISESRVLSKWGTQGHLFTHGITEVPADYGRTVRQYSVPTSQRALQLFKEYAISLGVAFAEQ